MSVEHLTTPDLWRAVWRLAEAWSQAPLVKDFASCLPRNQRLESRGSRAEGITALLEHLDLRAGTMMANPLMFGSRVPELLDEPLFSDAALIVDEDDLAAWLELANRIEVAHWMTVAWLRSRLAGYPMMRAPQLAPGTPLTTWELTIHHTWTKEEFAVGLNREPAPPRVPELLGVNTEDTSETLESSGELHEAARHLAQALKRSPAWIRFHDSLNELDEAGKADLRSARQELTERLSDETVDDHEEELALPRAEYRQHTTREVVDSLIGSAREHADAFNDVHGLLTLVACDVFAELALYGEPWPTPERNLEIPEPGHPIVAFEGQGAAGSLFTTGQVLWLSNESLADAVQIRTKSTKWDVEGVRDCFEARVLIGTSEGWPATTVHLPVVAQ